MRIHCSKDILLENIHIVSRAVAGRTTMPILECVLLFTDGDMFKMIANDLEMAIETGAIRADVIEPGAVCLEAKMFFEIIRRLPDGTVCISTDQNNVTVIQCARSEFKILGLSGDEFPDLPLVEKNHRYNIKAAEFKNMIRKTIFSVSLDDTKPIMTGELLEIKNETLHLVAVDGFRVSYCKTDMKTTNELKEMEDTHVVIPAKTLNEISKILPVDDGAVITMYIADKHVLMETDNYTVVSRILEGDFIKYEPLFTGDYATVVKADRLQLLMSLERASLIASKELKKNPIKLKIEGDCLTISSNTEAGNVTDELTVENDGNDLEIAFNPRYLMDALKVMEDGMVSMQFTTPLSPCVLKSIGSDDAKYLILPLRLNT